MGDAARFSNWLHNNQPTGVQSLGTTEDGAYFLNGATSDAALNAVSRNAAATWFIPSESEWYKAAYHQPATQGGDTDNYWAYPMGTNSAPYSDQPPGATPDNTRVGNFNSSDSVANGYNDGYAVTGSPGYSSSQNYLTDAGAYTLSTSPYGTFDQGGNVFEWNEALISASFRGLRGGSCDNNSNLLQSSPQFVSNPTNESNVFGFRVANVPEPRTGVLQSWPVGSCDGGGRGASSHRSRALARRVSIRTLPAVPCPLFPIRYPHSSAKFLSIRSPSRWLFSGWNCVALRLSRQIMAQKGAP